MSRHTLTRRSFLAGTAGVAGAATLAGYMGYGAWERAFADGGEDGTARAVPTLCNGCSNKCGFTAYVENGKVGKLIADTNNPMAKGKLCARGYALPQIAYSADRITDPLKKNDQGEFEAISWEQAYQEIGDKVKQIVASKGADALAIVEDPRPTGNYYSRRFMNALGSANIYTHGAACYLSRESAITQVIGTGSWSSDVGNAKMTMFIGRSYADGIRPAQIQAMEKAHLEKGSRIVLVDPRFTNSQKFADEWVPINPGTDLAFVLALCNVVVENGRYDKDFVKKNGHGFAAFAKQVRAYTPEWAADICGVSSDRISELASQMADAAPACSIESGWRGPSGVEYKNSGELARAIACFNGLMGCYNQKGGALLLPSVTAGELSKKKFPPVPQPEKPIVGSDEFPLALQSAGSAVYAAEAAGKGIISGMFFYNSNLVGGYANPSYMRQCLQNLELSVCIDVQMSETAEICDYVLPEVSYLERSELPSFNAGKVPSVSMRTQVIDVVHPNTKPADEIFKGLAEACGVGKYFDFTMEELAAAQLKTVGVDVDDARKLGTISFPDKAFSYGTAPVWNTPTGKFQFASEACEKAGYKAVPSWVEPEVMPGDGNLRLIDAKQPIHSHTMTANNESLMALTKRYDLTRVWMNTQDAADRGISDGDTVEISNDYHTGQVGCHVTDRIVQGAVYMPSGYGVTVEDQHTAYGVGLRPMDYLPDHLEMGYGSPETHEILVTVKKVSA